MRTHPQGWKEWGVALSAILAALSILTALIDLGKRGAGSINGYVDGRARSAAGQVVHDSLDVHRRSREHRYGRR